MTRVQQSRLDDAMYQHLTQQASHYERALDVVRKLPGAFAVREDRDQLLQELATISHTIRHSDHTAAATKQAYFASQHKPSPRLANAIDHVKVQIEQLIQSLNQSEAIARNMKDQLTPELDVQTKTQRMRKAYAQQGQGD